MSVERRMRIGDVGMVVVVLMGRRERRRGQGIEVHMYRPLSFLDRKSVV